MTYSYYTGTYYTYKVYTRVGFFFFFIPVGNFIRKLCDGIMAARSVSELKPF